MGKRKAAAQVQRKKPKKENAKGTEQQQSGKTHQKSIGSLKEKDPSFYEYLSKQDPELLNFEMSDSSSSDNDDDNDDNNDNDTDSTKDGIEHKNSAKVQEKDDNESASAESSAEDEDEDKDEDNIEEDEKDNNFEIGDLGDSDVDSDDESEDDEEPLKEDEFDVMKDALTIKEVDECAKEAFGTKSFVALRKFVRIFKDACHVSDIENCHYKINDPAVFKKVITVTLENAKDTFDFHLGISETKKNPSGSKKWKKCRSLVKGFLSNLLHFLRTSVDSMVLAFVLRRTHLLLPYFSCFPKLNRVLLKACLSNWEAAEEHVRVLSFLCIHQIAVDNVNLREPCLKGIYTTYAKNSKFMSKHNFPALQFMENCCVEMFGVDLALSYQYSFKYIRQLAVLLRIAMTSNKKESIQKVYNWQYIRCIRLLSRVISEYKEGMKDLIFPAVQVLIGTIKLIPTAQYFPLRLHCINSLNELASTGQPYIPLSHLITEMLNATCMKSKPIKSTATTVELYISLRFQKKYLGTKAFQNSMTKAIVNVFYSHLSNFSADVGFPEFAIPVIGQVRNYIKISKSPTLTKELKQVLTQVKSNVSFISTQRNIHMKDLNSKQSWKEQIASAGEPPLAVFYSRWKAIDNTFSNQNSEELKKIPKGKDIISESQKRVTDTIDNSDLTFGKDNKVKMLSDFADEEQFDDDVADVVEDINSMFSDDDA